MQYRLFQSSSILVACATLAACADSTNPAGKIPMSVSFTSGSSAGASLSSSPATSTPGTATSGTDVLVVTKAQLVVARMELQRSGASCGSTAVAGDDDVDEHECAELTVAPSVVDLPVNGTVASALSVTIPAGTYSALEAKIRPVHGDGDRGRGASAFLKANPDLAGVSVRVTGTFNGKEFTYTGSPRAEFETAFEPALTVDAAPVNLTINTDLSIWFKSQSGALIDPSTANAGGANVNTVANNIRRSFRAFRDDDHDGHEDRHH
jgi:hypothetical protein